MLLWFKLQNFYQLKCEEAVQEDLPIRCLDNLTSPETGVHRDETLKESNSFLAFHHALLPESVNREPSSTLSALSLEMG